MNDWDKVHAVLVWVITGLAIVGFGVMAAMWISL
jgi:hypothetical protein